MVDNPSEAQSEQKQAIDWNAFVGLAYSIAVFFGSQFGVGLVLSVGLLFFGGNRTALIDKLDSSAIVNFLVIAAIEFITIFLTLWFVKRRKVSYRAIGVDKPKLAYMGYALITFVVYLPLYILVLTLAHKLFPQINVNQHQQLSFNNSVSGSSLIWVFMGLVVLPPLAEEILCRGFLYTSLRKNMPKIMAALITSVLFAAAHLQFGTGKPLLWVAAIDTFVLSIVLVYVREKTDSIWPGVLVHAIKNGIAFASLFIFHLS